jgi:hypothetical protein
MDLKILSAFIRAIKLALGKDTIGNVVFYINDTLIHSRTFDEHPQHLDKLLTAYARMRGKAEKT